MHSTIFQVLREHEKDFEVKARWNCLEVEHESSLCWIRASEQCSAGIGGKATEMCEVPESS